MASLKFQFCTLMYKMFISQKNQRRLWAKHLFISQRRPQFESLQEIRRLQSSLNQEKYFFLKMLTDTCLMRKRRRSAFWWEQIRNKFSHNQWLKYLRMGKANFYILVNRLNPYLKAQNVRNISSEKQTAIALMSMASGKSNAYIGRLFLIRKSDVVTIIENVCEAIKCLMPHHLRVPGPSDVEDNIKDFEIKWGFPQCAGILGSIHVPLRTSNLPENATDYINNSNGHSIILQGIVDASYKFCDINVGWPGSVPESRVFTSSQLWLKGQDRNLFPDTCKELCGVNVPIYILAGTSYPLSHWVLRPFLNEPASKKEQIFNEKFKFAYNACEIAFKRLKARWTCLVHGNICSIEVFPTVIAACCVLHNMCEMNKEILLDDWIVKAENNFKQPIPSPCNTVIGPQAENIRFAVNEYFINTS